MGSGQGGLRSGLRGVGQPIAGERPQEIPQALQARDSWGVLRSHREMVLEEHPPGSSPVAKASGLERRVPAVAAPPGDSDREASHQDVAVGPAPGHASDLQKAERAPGEDRSVGARADATGPACPHSVAARGVCRLPVSNGDTRDQRQHPQAHCRLRETHLGWN